MIKNKGRRKRTPFYRTVMFREMLISCMAALVLSVFFMAISCYGMLYYVEKYVVNEVTRQARSDQVMSELQAYVAREKLSTTNVREIRQWQTKKSVVLHFIGTKESLAAENELQKEYENTVINLQEQTAFRTYEIKFRDQTAICYPELKTIRRYYSVCILVSAAAAILLFGVLLMLFMGRRIRYVVMLKEDIENMKASGLTELVAVKGRDELTEIAKSMNEVRESVLNKIQTEREAISANHELITAMSHDLRTPLTRQIGYLEILSRKKYQSEQELYEYIDKARRNAYLMKDTTDKLFRYFLAFGKEDTHQKQTEVEGKTLFNAALKEQIAYITSQGFVVSCEEVSAPFRLKIDPEEFSRIFDNIFQNIKKYAEPAVPICITHILEKDEFILMFQNGMKEDMSKVESTKIGLKIVEKVMKSMGGSMEVMNDGQFFIIQLVFRLITQ